MQILDETLAIEEHDMKVAWRATWKSMLSRYSSAAALALTALLLSAAGLNAQELSTLHPERRTGFANGGWNLDRYQDLEPLNAGKKIVVADLKGPGIIRLIHTTRHKPEELFARGIVLEIWFDDAKQPAVMSPLADFFGDGCNGSSMNFTTPLVECAPWSYNAYFPMPFARRARVMLRNDTGRNTGNYSYVEWEHLDTWDRKQGYFHATYRRDSFQLNKQTDHVFFELKGNGHLVGRQFSVITDEPIFRDFEYVMEGNNEVDIDGRKRRIDYLGSEDSFTFSWGFQQTFAGLRAGMTLVDKGDTARVSLYRFHDHMPIRFTNSVRWHINWSQERLYTTGEPQAGMWDTALQRNGCWVEYAHVYYWYQDQPGGFEHTPLPPVEERIKPMLRSNRQRG
jgi:hypothetical protein